MTRTALTLALALAALQAPACSKSKPKPPAAQDKPTAAAGPAEATKVDVSDLWALAPPEAVGGVAALDGSLERYLEATRSILGLLEASPIGKQAVGELRGALADAPWDVLDPAAWKRAGLDLTKGGAAFFGAGGSDEPPRLLVLPVGDLAAFRATAKVQTRKEGDREIDAIKEKVVCAMASGRYLCAPSLEAIDAAAKPHASPLADAVKRLPADERGDVLLYLDVARIPELKRDMSDDLGEVTAMLVSTRLAPDGLTARVRLQGTIAKPEVKIFFGAGPTPELAAAAAGAVGVVRLHIDPAVAFASAPPSIPLPNGIDVRKDLFDQLTGDLQLATVGTGMGTAKVHMVVKDPAKVGAALQGICELGKSLNDPGMPVAGLAWADGACSGTVDLAKGAGGQLPPGLVADKAPFRLAVEGKLLTASLALAGDLSAGSLGDLTGSAEARAALAGGSTFSTWGTALDLVAAELPAPISAMLAEEPALAAQVTAIVDLAGSLLARVYEVSVTGKIEAGGIDVALHLTTYGGDPADARAAYEAAVAKRAGGDVAGYKAALAEIATRWPASLAGKRARQVAANAPVLGFGTGIGAAVAIPAFLRYTRQAKTSEAALGVKQIYEGARTYYEDESAARGSLDPKERRFPGSTPWTPPLGACCKQPGGKCAPDPKLWDTDPWRALKFMISDPGRYSYRFVSEGTGPGSRFSVTAVGDLDCDGIYSTFEMVGSVAEDGTVTGQAAMYKNMETE